MNYNYERIAEVCTKLAEQDRFKDVKAKFAEWHKDPQQKIPIPLYSIRQKQWHEEYLKLVCLSIRSTDETNKEFFLRQSEALYQKYIA